MAWGRAALAVVAAVVVGVVVVSGGSGADPRTPVGLPGTAAPFLGTAVTGDGGLTAAVDAYADVVDLRPSPTGPALIDNPSARQTAGTVAADTGIVPRVRIGGGPALPLWRADSVAQRYLPRTDVVRTVARFGAVRVSVNVAAVEGKLAVAVRAKASEEEQTTLSLSLDTEGGVRCARGRQAGELDLLCRVGRARLPALDAAAQDVRQQVSGVIRRSAAADRGWLARARSLGDGAPAWARRMYGRSLLVLRALTGRRSGAVAAGARDGWAHVWPRDAATAALAFEAAGYGSEARRVASFLTGLDLGAAARFTGDGEPVPGRGAQGDAPGWVRVAAGAVGLGTSGAPFPASSDRGDAPDYQEDDPGDFLGNAIVAGADLRPFETPRGLVRRAGDPASGLDSAAAWAVRPFPTPGQGRRVGRTLLQLLAAGTPYGITPGEAWAGGTDPWTAPTAWSAWTLAALGDRAAALRLLADLRRAATPAGSLPERVDARTGLPRSTTPLGWTHAFAVLALREFWPSH